MLDYGHTWCSCLVRNEFGYGRCWWHWFLSNCSCAVAWSYSAASITDWPGVVCYDVDTSVSLPMPMPNLTLPSGLSVPLPNVSLPYMPSTGVSLTAAPMMPPVNLPVVGGAATMPLTTTQLDAAVTAAAAHQCMDISYSASVLVWCTWCTSFEYLLLERRCISDLLPCVRSAECSNTCIADCLSLCGIIWTKMNCDDVVHRCINWFLRFYFFHIFNGFLKFFVLVYVFKFLKNVHWKFYQELRTTFLKSQK